MNKKTKTNTQSTANEAKRKPRFLTIFICISLAVLLLFGSVMLTVTLVIQGSYVVKYEGYGMTEEVARYFASVYKYRFIINNRLSSVGGFSDTPEFWAKTPDGSDKSYGELLSEGYERYVKEVLVASSLYFGNASLGRSEKAKIEEGIDNVLAIRGIDGVKANFNEATEIYGFDYGAFEDAAELQYCYARARNLLYGEIELPLCEEYLDTYTHVKLLFVNADAVAKGEGTIKEDIAALDAAIQNGTVSPQMFDNLMKYNSVSGLSASGDYYFHESAQTTSKLCDQGFTAVVERSLGMKVGEFSDAIYPDGICYIYKTEPEVGAYADTTLEVFFTDFAVNASYYFYSKTLGELAAEATLSEDFSKIDIISIPYNYLYRTEY